MDLMDAADDPHRALGRWIAQRQASKVEYKKIINERENALLDPNQRYGPRSNQFLNARSELEEARLQRHEVQSVLRRPLNRYELPWRTFVIFAMVLAFLEGSVNKFLFDVALHSYGFVSYATSFVVAFSMVILAHLAGKSLRQVWSEYRSRVVWSSVGIFLVIVVVLATIVSILTIGRAATDANAGIATFQDMFGAVTSSVVQVGLWRTLTGAFANLNALVLATVNFAGIFAAMMLAFFTHDPDKDYDLAATKVDRHRAELEKLDQHYTKARARIVDKYRSHITAASGRFKAANREVMQLKHRLSEPLDDDDKFLIDEWDQLAEMSEHGDKPSNRPTDDGQGPGSTPHLKPVDTPAARRA
jgi:hypothetical protein